MLEGITVLNEYPIMDYEFNFLAAAIMGIVCCTIVCLLFGSKEVPFELAPFICLIVLTALAFIATGCLAAKEVPTSAKEYQVTIEDYVSINDVYDYYEVVDKEGDIWTIRKLIDNGGQG